MYKEDTPSTHLPFTTYSRREMWLWGHKSTNCSIPERWVQRRAASVTCLLCGDMGNVVRVAGNSQQSGSANRLTYRDTSLAKIQGFGLVHFDIFPIDELLESIKGLVL